MIVFMSILNFVAAMHSGGFYQFFVRWIHNSHYSESTRYKIGKSHHCAMCNDAIFFMTRTFDLDALQRKEKKSVKNLQN